MEKAASERIHAHYVAQFLGAIHLMIAPNVIVVDGPYAGKEQNNFLQNVRHEFQETMGGADFIQHGAILAAWKTTFLNLSATMRAFVELFLWQPAPSETV